FLSGARVGQVETFRKAYIGLGRHPLSDVRCDAERDLDVSSRHAGIVRHGAREVARLQARADSLEAEGQRLLTRLQTELASVRDALRQSQTEVGRLRA